MYEYGIYIYYIYVKKQKPECVKVPGDNILELPYFVFNTYNYNRQLYCMI